MTYVLGHLLLPKYAKKESRFKRWRYTGARTVSTGQPALHTIS
jgi:hypothetical protein